MSPVSKNKEALLSSFYRQGTDLLVYRSLMGPRGRKRGNLFRHSIPHPWRQSEALLTEGKRAGGKLGIQGRSSPLPLPLLGALRLFPLSPAPLPPISHPPAGTW